MSNNKQGQPFVLATNEYGHPEIKLVQDTIAGQIEAKTNEAPKVDDTQPEVIPVDRYKNLQADYTRKAQRLSDLEKQNIALLKDLEYRDALLQASTPPANATEDWGDYTKLPALIDKKLGDAAQQLLSVIPEVVQAHLAQNPAMKEATLQTDFNKTLALSKKEGVDFKALVPDIYFAMSVNPALLFSQAYEAAKIRQADAKPSQGGATQGAKSNPETIKERAERLNLESNESSASLVKGGAKEPEWKPGMSTRQMMLESYKASVKDAGLVSSLNE